MHFLKTILGSIEIGTLTVGATSLLMVVKHSTEPRIAILGRIKGPSDKFKPMRDFPNATRVEDILIIKIEAPIFFANSGQVKRRTTVRLF